MPRLAAPRFVRHSVAMRERTKIVLACSVCEARNYKTTKKRGVTERLSLKKYCPHCRQHTEHRESR